MKSNGKMYVRFTNKQGDIRTLSFKIGYPPSTLRCRNKQVPYTVISKLEFDRINRRKKSCQK